MFPLYFKGIKGVPGPLGYHESVKLESVLGHRLRAASGAEKLAVAAEALALSGGRFDAELADFMAVELTRLPAEPDPLTLIPWLAQLPHSATTAFLLARIATDARDLETAAQAWERFFQSHAQRDPFHLLAYARVLTDLQRFKEAALLLQRALEQPLKYVFFSRSEKLIQRLSPRIDSHLRQCRIAVLGTSGSTLLIPVLKAFALRDRIQAEFYEGLYGSATQEILDPASGLAKFRPDIVFLIASWRDLHLPAVTSDESAFSESLVERQKSLWERLAGQFGCHVVQHAFDFPVEEAYGYLARALPGGRSRVIEAVNAKLMEAAPSHVSVLDVPELQREAGKAWQDANLWYTFQQHPSTEALPALGEAMTAHVRAVLGLSRKVLVTDLDNTLWKGVIGEDGLDGIKVGPGSPAGEAHVRLQQYLLDLKARGILLAAASKNNHDDAALPFQKHAHMLLRMEDFAAFEANWNDKASSIREMARKLSLGLDSFVFLDDNPLEREWVRSQLPEVAVVELGASAFHYVQDLDRRRLFYAISLSAEDRARSEQYRGEAERKHLQATSQSIDEFLAQLQLRASCAPVVEKNMARVTQLTNKTNQFNLTTRRYTEAQVRQLVDRAGAWAGAFHLADRMGDYGLIGVVFCLPGPQAGQWEIDTWLMSCRVLGRQMEKYMFDRLVEAARERGITEIAGVFKPTQKNALVRDHYPQLGFTRAGEEAGEVRYRYAVPDETAPSAIHILNDTMVNGGKNGRL